MSIQQEVKKQEQMIARCEKSLALEKLKKRRADTRHKIELGGLIIKSGMNFYEKAIVLGGLFYVKNLLINGILSEDFLESHSNEI